MKFYFLNFTIFPIKITIIFKQSVVFQTPSYYFLFVISEVDLGDKTLTISVIVMFDLHW